MVRQRRQATPSSNPSANNAATASNPSAIDSEESKRVANRLAQRKFRRQRKDYIAHLERELALCREGASGELIHRRQEIERLNKEKAGLRELLEQISVTLARLCGVSITIEAASQPSDQSCEARVPSRSASHDQQDAVGSQAGPTVDGHPASVDEGEVEIRSEDEGEDIAGSEHGDGGDAVVELDHDGSSPLADEALNTQVDIEMQADISMDRVAPSQQDQEPSNIVEPLPDSYMFWGHEPDASVEGTVACLQAELDQVRVQIQTNPLPTTGEDQVPILTTANGLGPYQSGQMIVGTPTVPDNVCCSTGCLGQHNGSEKTQMMTIMLRRQVDDLLDPFTSPDHSPHHLQSLQALEKHLVDGLAEIIVSMQALAMRLLGIPSICLSGGSAWVVWQVVKTFWVLPRLADAGIVARAVDVGFASDILRDTMPDWLRPMDIQKTFEHNPAIDFIPWASLREALILRHDDVPIDDIMVNLLTREMPTGADLDRPADPAAGMTLLKLRGQFRSTQDRLLRDSFYHSPSMFKLAKTTSSGTLSCTSLLVDTMMAGSPPITAAGGCTTRQVVTML